MERRKFLMGVGSASLGGSALLGTGAFSRVESQRNVSVAVAEDPDAYLGLDKCSIDGSETPNSSYAWPDDHGHLEILMNPDNPTIEGNSEEVDDSPLGEGINSDSRTWFDNVFQICNQGKEEICIWIGDDDDWPRVDDDDGERRVDFYIAEDDGRSIVGAENQYRIALGNCVCIGIKTNTKGLEAGDELLDVFDDEIVIHADVDCAENGNGDVRGETAWALKRDTEPTDNTLDSFETISKWGWYVPYEQRDGREGDPVLADLIAGAGQNDPDNGDDVADVEIYDDGESLFIEIEMDEEWTLGNSEVFAGTRDGLAETNAAPGQFPFKEDGPEADSYTIPLEAIDEDLEVIAIHADVTTET